MSSFPSVRRQIARFHSLARIFDLPRGSPCTDSACKLSAVTAEVMRSTYLAGTTVFAQDHSSNDSLSLPARLVLPSSAPCWDLQRFKLRQVRRVRSGSRGGLSQTQDCSHLLRIVEGPRVAQPLVPRILLVTSHDCHERDLLEALRDGAEQKSDFVVELVSFDLEHSTNFSWYSPARSLTIGLLLGGAPGVAGRNVVTSAPQLRSRTATTRNTTGNTRSVQTRSPTGEKVAQSNSEMEASCWFLEQALRCKYRCSWSSLKTLVGRRLRTQ